MRRRSSRIDGTKKLIDRQHLGPNVGYDSSIAARCASGVNSGTRILEEGDVETLVQRVATGAFVTGLERETR